MVVSEVGDGGGIGVDCSVGTIVWVRRRNGSWWPGRILGPEELSASHLMSPRSGTPVKLLGREDASVDWYNLEKSKRVKAFRCGEFDDCIEKAEASLGVPIKKREKYARREDAILHALELERKQVELKQQKQAIITNGNASKPLGAVKREFNNISSSDTLTQNNESLIHDEYDTVKSVLPEEQKIINSMNINDGKDGKQVGGVKDVSEGLPRMRGLLDFGLGIDSKKKLAQSSSCLNARKPAVHDKDSLISSGNIVRGTVHVSSGKNSLTNNQKISDSGMLEESLIKKRDRRRPLLQVLQTSAKLEAPYSSQLNQYPLAASFQGEKDHRVMTCRAKRSRCIYLSAHSVGPQDDGSNSSEETQIPEDQLVMDNCLTQPGSLAAAYSSEMSETDESDSCTRDYLDTEMQEGDISGDPDRFFASKPKNCDTTVCYIYEEIGVVDNDKVDFASDISQLHRFEHSADVSSGMGVSKWHMKGKRNIRNVVKMPVDVMDGKVCVSGFDKCRGSERETSYVTRSEDQGLYQIKKERYNVSDEVNLISEDFFQEQISGYKSHSYRDLVFNNLERNSREMLTSEWEADKLSHVAQRKYWEESGEFNDPGYAAHANSETESILFDVNLKVKASYQGEHVPLVSLMSRLNGKAIIGHPIQIEILDDGSTSQYICSTDVCPDENTVQQPVWRTARRTAMQRVPRSNPLASSLEDDEVGGSRFSDRQNKCSLNVYSDHPKNQSRIAKNKVFHAHQPQSGKFQKSLKRLSLSSQKTRTLSSFASEKRFGGQDGNPEFARGRGVLSGLMKPEGQVPSVTCVPVKVAFSRILEAIGRPSSMVSHHVRMATSSNNRSIVVKQLCASRG